MYKDERRDLSELLKIEFEMAPNAILISFLGNIIKRQKISKEIHDKYWILTAYAVQNFRYFPEL